MSFKLILVIFFISIFSLSCNNVQDVQTELSKSDIKNKLENLKQLGTVEYTLSKVLIVDDDKDWFKVGDRKALITLKAYLLAGLNFSDIEINDFETNRFIKLTLPKPEVIYLNIPPEEIDFSLLKSSYFRSEFSNQELNEIQVMGENNIKEKISELGVFEEATKNAKFFLDRWLKLLGFKNITYRDSSSDTSSIQ